MSLLSSKITSRKKLSLKDAKIEAPEDRALHNAEPVKEVERPIGEEDIAYTKLLQVNPVLDKLIDTFDLVSKRTGERVKKASSSDIETAQKEMRLKDEVDNREEIERPGEALKKPKDNSKLSSLAQRLLPGADSISKEEIIARLQEETKVNQGRAEIGFNMMLEAGIIIQVNQLNKYYLQGSTPF